jgi:hypothetical protein
MFASSRLIFLIYFQDSFLVGALLRDFFTKDDILLTQSI